MRVQIPLSEAIERLNNVPGVRQSTYEPYRRHAAAYGRINLGGHSMPVVKQGRRWMVEESDAEAGVELHREKHAKLAQMTSDYESRILHPGVVEIIGGGYKAGASFHFVWNHMAAALKKSDGFWRCNSCWNPATVAHEGEECHKCRDWGSCGGQCTVSGMTCRLCHPLVEARPER